MGLGLSVYSLTHHDMVCALDLILSTVRHTLELKNLFGNFNILPTDQHNATIGD